MQSKKVKKLGSRSVFFWAFHLVLGMSANSPRIFAAEQIPLIYQDKIIESYEVDLSLVVTTNHSGKNYTDPQVKLLKKLGLERLTSLGFNVSKGGDVQDDMIVGSPIWFDRSSGAVAVLTKEVVIKTKPTQYINILKQNKLIAEISRLEDIGPDLYLIKVGSTIDVSPLIKEMSINPEIEYAHPNFIVPKDFRQAALLPENEEFFPEQWHLENIGQTKGAIGADIKAKEAWLITEGSPNIVVAIIDSGFDVKHVDLKDAWQTNAGEIPGNRKDDDGNGYIDDIIGWNFSANSASFNTTYDADHGTAVAGLIAAQKNGFGTIGVCPGCKLIPIATNFTPVYDARAFLYALKRGADIISNSWGYDIGTPQTKVVTDAINEVATKGRGGKGTVILFAMNNLNRDDCIGSKPDISSIAEVVAISGSNHMDKKVSGSAWGSCMEFLSTTRDYDRVGIVSTDVTGKYGYNTYLGSSDLPNLDYTKNFGGTSAATPIAAGAFGLALSLNPDLTREEVIAYFKIGADKINEKEAKYNNATGFSTKYGYGRINTYATLIAISNDMMSP